MMIGVIFRYVCVHMESTLVGCIMPVVPAASKQSMRGERNGGEECDNVLEHGFKAKNWGRPSEV